jgi:hypothetical protein
MVKSIIPQVFTSLHDASLHLIQYGWVVVSLLTTEQVRMYTNDIHDSLSFIENSQDCDIFHPKIPRVLGGMLKSHHISMLRPVHEIRKLARSRFYDFLQSADYHLYDYTNFPIPNNLEDLTCNPDAIYVSSGLQPKFPRGASQNIQQGGLWWHVDTDTERSFIQGSIVLENPHGSEEFCVVSESHKHFDILDDSRRLGSDFYMLNSQDLTNLKERGCEALSLQVPEGSYVLWFSSTVHTVKPFSSEGTSPRIQVYATFAPTTSIVGDERKDLELMKSLAVLLGGSCRHLPYPCEITWQNGNRGLYRDLIPFEELPEIFMFSNKEDYTNSELSVYGLNVDTLRYSIEYWSKEWNEQMMSFMF